jgi:alkanesulfonate monooxygenase SsuD/methylene tetrahydromethanopterin reductase-like flavin-dependent oxidoreductase (luciferase family)
VIPMFHGERPTFSGAYYRIEGAINEPRYRDHIPIMLGGGGEKKTFRLAAQYADHMNISADLSELDPSAVPAEMSDRIIAGNADQIAEQIQRKVLDVGIEGVILHLPLHGHIPGTITKVGEALKPLVGA